MDENYRPVSCDFYDELEALATLKKNCEVVFLQNESLSVIHGKIEDLYVRNKVEYLKMDSGLEIRLDKLVQVDGKQSSKYC